MTEAPWDKPEQAPSVSDYVIHVYKATKDKSWSTLEGVHLRVFLGVMTKYLPKVRTELVRVIASRAQLTRKELTMSDEVDKPRIIIPPNINIGARDVQLKFQSVGDGMYFQLSAQEGDEPGADVWQLFRFVPGRGLMFFRHVDLQTTKDFPVDDEGRLQLVDEELKPLVQVYPEQVRDDEKPAAGIVEWNGGKWRLMVHKERMILQFRAKESPSWLGLISLTPQGLTLWTGVPPEMSGIANEDGESHVRVLDKKA